MPKKNEPKKYALAWERIGNITPTPEEILEIKRITEKEKHRDLLKVFLMLRKRGEGKKIIMALCDLGDKAFDKINTLMDSSAFLSSQISLAQKYFVKDTAAVGEEVFEGDPEPATMDDAPALMEEKVLKMLNAITDAKIADASLDEIGNTIAKIFDKYRTATGQTNQNIGIGIAVVKDSKLLDDKKLKFLLDQVDRLERALNVLATRENQRAIAGPADKDAGRDNNDQRAGPAT
jgi:hypothetical protein